MSDVRAGGAYVELMTRDKKFNDGLKRAKFSLINFASGAYLVKTAFQAVRGVYSAVIGATTHQVQQEAKLAAVLKATGNAAGFTADQLKEQAADLQKITTFADEAVIGMQAVLATFKEVKGDQFRDAQKSILDMSQVLGQDLKSSAIQVGKALNDPVKGVSALARVGVSFTQSQKDQIKAMTQVGDVAGAQKLILAELQSEFGGAAEAAAKAGGGPLKQFGNVLGDIMEIVGGYVLPALDGIAVRVMDVLGPAMTWMHDNTSSVLTSVGEAWNSLLEFVSPVAFGIGTIVTDVFSAIASVVQSVWGVVADATGSVMSWLQETIVGVLSTINFAWNNWQLLLQVALTSGELGIVRFANQVAYFFTQMLPAYLSWFGDNWRDVFTDIANLTATIAGNIWENLKSLWDAIAGLLSGDGWDFEWTPLTKGFESAIKELPQIAERQMGPLETELQDQMNSLGEQLNSAWDDHTKEFGKKIDKYSKQVTDFAGVDLSAAGGNAADSGAKAIAAVTPAAGASKQKVFASFSAAALAAQGGGGGGTDPGFMLIVKAIEKAEKERQKREERTARRQEQAGLLGA